MLYSSCCASTHRVASVRLHSCGDCCCCGLVDTIRQMITQSSDGAAVVDSDYFWRPIASCPVGKKVQLINKKMGCATYGVYKPSERYWTHWAPLPKFEE